MISVCGVVQARPGAASVVHAMADVRRMAGGAHTVVHEFQGGALGWSGAIAAQARLGSLAAWLLRPAGEDTPQDGAALERILRACGGTAVPQPQGLGGAFLLVVRDEDARRLLILNDRFGVCPVYFRASGEDFCFATKPDALFAAGGAPREIDAQAVYDYVFFHCIPSPRTIYRGVRKMAPGECLVWNDREAESRAYWQPQFAARDGGAAALGPQLLELLEAAVARRTRPHCGAFLSGGLDSSSVAGMLKRSDGRADTFTIGFDAEGYDETSYARIAARHFGTEHHEYFVTPADVLAALPGIAAFYGEPFGNSSVIPSYYCAKFAREHGVSLLLAGDGGDELFAGNTRYVEQRKFDIYFDVPAPLRAALEAGYRFLPVLASLPVAGKGARYIQQAKMGLPDRLQSYNFLNRFDPRSVFQGDWFERVDSEEPWQLWRERYARPTSGDALQRMLFLDWKFTLADNDLVKVSNMCALAGVDVCYPMLDDALVDFSATVSAATLLANGELRGFYKAACRDFLPSEILHKSKHGFGLPFGVWMREDRGLIELAQDTLAALRTRDIFRREFIDQSLEHYRKDAATSYYGELIWILTMLEIWLREHA